MLHSFTLLNCIWQWSKAEMQHFSYDKSITPLGSFDSKVNGSSSKPQVSSQLFSTVCLEKTEIPSTVDIHSWSD